MGYRPNQKVKEVVLITLFYVEVLIFSSKLHFNYLSDNICENILINRWDWLQMHKMAGFTSGDILASFVDNGRIMNYEGYDLNNGGPKSLRPQ